MSEMPVERLRGLAGYLRASGLRRMAEDVDRCASTLEADRTQHITDMAYIEAADETIAQLRARIEALEFVVNKDGEIAEEREARIEALLVDLRKTCWHASEGSDYLACDFCEGEVKDGADQVARDAAHDPECRAALKENP